MIAEVEGGGCIVGHLGFFSMSFRGSDRALEVDSATDLFIKGTVISHQDVVLT